MTVFTLTHFYIGRWSAMHDVLTPFGVLDHRGLALYVHVDVSAARQVLSTICAKRKRHTKCSNEGTIKTASQR